MKKFLTKKKVRNVGTAELKITIFALFIIVLGLIVLVTYTLVSNNLFTEAANQFWLCHATEESNCKLGLLLTFNIIVPLIFIFLSLLPVIGILFSCDVQACKKKTKSLWSKILK